MIVISINCVQIVIKKATLLYVAKKKMFFQQQKATRVNRCRQSKSCDLQAMTPGQRSQLQQSTILTMKQISGLCRYHEGLSPIIYCIHMITQASATEQNNTQSFQNCTPNSGSMNAVDQIKRSQQYDEQRKKNKIKLKQLSLATYNVQTLQQTGKFHQPTWKAATWLTDIITVQEYRMIICLEIDTIKRWRLINIYVCNNNKTESRRYHNFHRHVT